MQVFMVERDLSGTTLSDLNSYKAAAIRQAKKMYDAGDRVRYLRSTFVPEDGGVYACSRPRVSTLLPN